MSSPHIFRNPLAFIKIQTCPSNPAELWQFQHEISQDFIQTLQLTEEAVYNMALLNLEDIISIVVGSSLETLVYHLSTRNANESVVQEY